MPSQTTFGKIEMEKTVIKVANERLRPFSSSAQIKCRSYSYYLQRAIVDFGADVSFQEAQKKLLEHYRLELPVSSIQAIVENHAKNVFEFLENEDLEEGTAQQIVAELDGSMIPVVDTEIPKDGKADKRRGRSLRWQEARLCFARGAKLITPIFYATMGDVEGAIKSAGFIKFRQLCDSANIDPNLRWLSMFSSKAYTPLFLASTKLPQF